jgi:hypothetical protein
MFAKAFARTLWVSLVVVVFAGCWIEVVRFTSVST